MSLRAACWLLQVTTAAIACSMLVPKTFAQTTESEVSLQSHTITIKIESDIPIWQPFSSMMAPTTTAQYMQYISNTRSDRPFPSSTILNQLPEPVAHPTQIFDVNVESLSTTPLFPSTIILYTESCHVRMSTSVGTIAATPPPSSVATSGTVVPADHVTLTPSTMYTSKRASKDAMTTKGPESSRTLRPPFNGPFPTTQGPESSLALRPPFNGPFPTTQGPESSLALRPPFNGPFPTTQGPESSLALRPPFNGPFPTTQGPESSLALRPPFNGPFPPQFSRGYPPFTRPPGIQVESNTDIIIGIVIVVAVLLIVAAIATVGLVIVYKYRAVKRRRIGDSAGRNLRRRDTPWHLYYTEPAKRNATEIVQE